MKEAVVQIAGEALTLLPERAIWWAARRTLLVADPHFGKAATFRALGVPVPRGTTTGTLARLDAIIARNSPDRLIFLGDFLHAAEGRDPETLRVLNEWRRNHQPIEMTLVRGNHDARAGDPPRELDMHCVTGPHAEPPFAFDHHPRPAPGAFVLCGHIHPAVTLTGIGRQHSRLPCFWFGKDVGVLPAFGEFTGVAEADVRFGDQVFVVADDSVVAVPIVER